ncbi:ATP-binding protein [Methanoculleus sp. FWC-SCC3]|uniref:ATP-binding protein n=1 Tax=Methanoculleus methanifontis TaxID=2584086 RepID=A0ABT8M3U6_9EURY|nr:AAA family ATPase [Methanoculleus sp. FWC-SCC3]MDN7012950.1 ATP-binding protein [Methanoculleus sp. FWC-SCC3]
MDEIQQQVGGVSYAPSPPEEFCGRREELEQLSTILSRAGEHGQTVMISGPPGIGKSSLLNRLAYEVQEHPGGRQSPVLRAEAFDLPGMIFSAVRELLSDLQRSAASARFTSILDVESMREAIRYADDVFEKYAAPVEPIGLLPKGGEEIVGVFARSPEVGYDRVYQAFEELLGELGRQMSMADRVAAVLLDDVHLASSHDRRLLRDAVRNLPPGILLAFTCRIEDGAGSGYATMQEEIQELGIEEVQLTGMRKHEIRELGERRFHFSIDDAAAGLLEERSGDPFALMACFNTLRNQGLAPSRENVTDIIAGEKDPAGLIFDALPESMKAWTDDLCVLNPPFPVPVMACMLELQGAGVAPTTDQLLESGMFRRLPGDEYAFAHPLLQEHCRNSLTEDTQIALNARAADCFERSIHRLPSRLHVLLSLAGHLFHAREYGKAADLNLEIGLRFHHRDDHDIALMLTERAIVSAEQLGDDALLAAAERQRDLIRQRASGALTPGQ